MSDQLRDHSRPCDDDLGPYETNGGWWACTRCPGGREVTAFEIQEMARSLWQAERMDEYHWDVL